MELEFDFNESTLWMTPRSPFARRIRIAFSENEVSFREKLVDVFQPDQKLLRLNPLGRVPVLVLKTGEVFIDSTIILDLFYETHAANLPDYPKELRVEAARWSAIALGVCEGVVSFYLDSLRPKEHQDLELQEEVHQNFQRVLTRLESHFEKSDSSRLWRTQVTRADWDMGVALDYASFRISNEWEAKYPRTRAYLESLRARPSFINTKPS